MTTAQQKRLKEIEDEWRNVAFERQEYTHDNSAEGFARWQELWDRGVELGIQRDKFLKEVAA